MKVLVIDDEDDVRSIARLSLTKIGGMEVHEAASGPAGLRAAVQIRPDAILLDVMMPDMDGPATLRALRQDPKTSAIPVVFMTARVQAHEVARYRALGAKDVIAKPFDPLTLADTVRTIWNAMDG